MAEQAAWLVGDLAHDEFAAAAVGLRSRYRCVEFKLPQDVVRDARTAPPPAAIVLMAARPGRFSNAEVEQLHCCEPLAQLVAVLGSWCEGEMRSGRPWPGVDRYYWHQWSALAARLDDAAAQLPRTATSVDRAQQRVTFPAHRDALLAICTSRHNDFAALADACTLAGYRSFWQLPHLPMQARGVDLLLCDGLFPENESLAASEIPRVAILDFPRQADAQRALAAGFVGVIARPFELSCLFAAIAAALPKQVAR